MAPLSHLRLLSKPQTRLAAPIKDGKDLAQKHVAEDIDVLAGIALQSTKALRARDLVVVERGAGNRKHVAGDGDAKVGESGRAAEHVAALAAAVFGAGHLLVVGGDDVVVEQDQRGARVGDGARGGRVGLRGRLADAERVGLELPVALAAVDGGVVDLSAVFGAVDRAELVLARAVFVQVDGEDGRGQAGLGVGEPRLLLHGLHVVQVVEAKAQQAVAGRVLGELVGDGLCDFDGLAVDGHAADCDGVGADDALGRALVAVLEVEGVAGLGLEAGARRAELVLA